MKNKKPLLTVAIILFLIGIAILMIVAVINSRDDTPGLSDYYDYISELSDCVDYMVYDTEEPELVPEIAFLTEYDWIRDGDCGQHICFHRDFTFSYWCDCGSSVDSYDVYDRFEYKDSVITVIGDDFTAKMNVIYYDENYLCLYLEEEEECRVFINYDYADSDYVEHDPKSFAMNNWTELHALGYDGKYIKAAPYNYDGDAKNEFKEYIKDLRVSEDVEFYSVTSTDNNGELTTEHFKLEESDLEHIGEYYTGGYAQFDIEGNIRYFVFYGKTIIQ